MISSPGPPIDRGEVASAKLISVLKLEDDGEQDDKSISIQFDSPIKKADSIEELDERFPGITQILDLGFTHYRDNGKMKSLFAKGGYFSFSFSSLSSNAALTLETIHANRYDPVL